MIGTRIDADTSWAPGRGNSHHGQDHRIPTAAIDRHTAGGDVLVIRDGCFLPGDPVTTILGTTDHDPAVEAQIRADLNLDDPFFVRYANWLGDAVTGDLGNSYTTDQPVADTISSRLPVTLQLAVMSILISVIVAIPIGVMGAYKQSKWQDTASSTFVQVALSIPNFIVGIFLDLALRREAGMAARVELEPPQ